MRLPLRFSVPMILSALAVMPASAQTPQIITFDDAIDIALERNANLRQAQIDAAEGDVGVSDARANFLPEIALNATGGRNYGSNFDQTEGRVLKQTTSSLSLGASSGVTLFNGFRGISILRQAQFTRTAGRQDLKRAEETTVFTVASNFLSLLEFQEQLQVQRKNLADEANLEQQIQQYVEAGSRPLSDLQHQAANVAAARLAVLEAQSTAEVAEVDLMETLQLDPAGRYEFQLPAMSTELAEQPALEELLERAFSQRADLRAEEARLASAEAGVWAARADYWPKLSLTGVYGSSYSNASDSSFDEQLNAQRGGVVGLQLSIPLFSGGATRSQARRAHLEARRAKTVLEAAREKIGLQLRRAYLDYRAAGEQFSVAQAQQQAAERAVQTSEERFKAGVTTLVEVSQARALYVLAESALARTRSNLLLERTLMDYYLGDFDRKKFAAQ